MTYGQRRLSRSASARALAAAGLGGIFPARQQVARRAGRFIGIRALQLCRGDRPAAVFEKRVGAPSAHRAGSW